METTAEPVLAVLAHNAVVRLNHALDEAHQSLAALHEAQLIDLVYAVMIAHPNAAYLSIEDNHRNPSIDGSFDIVLGQVLDGTGTFLGDVPQTVWRVGLASTDETVMESGWDWALSDTEDCIIEIFTVLARDKKLSDQATARRYEMLTAN